MPRERPIIFSGPMVRAILAGHKTQTRRIQSGCNAFHVGMRLWVREAWAVPGTVACSDDPVRPGMRVVYRADTEESYSWRPSIFMPRWAARLFLDVTAVRVERLQDITEEDALDEGVEGAAIHSKLNGVEGDYVVGSARDEFARLWDVINDKRAAWASNPWVCVVKFKRVEETMSHDAMPEALP